MHQIYTILGIHNRKMLHSNFNMHIYRKQRASYPATLRKRTPLYRHRFSREELKTINFTLFLPCRHNPSLTLSQMTHQPLPAPHSLQALQGQDDPQGWRTLGSSVSPFAAQMCAPQKPVIPSCETIPHVFMLNTFNTRSVTANSDPAADNGSSGVSHRAMHVPRLFKPFQRYQLFPS